MMWWAVSTFYIQSFCNNFEFSFLIELLFPLGRLGLEVTLFLGFGNLWPSLIRINVTWIVRLGPVCLPVTLVVSILLVWLDQVQQQALELCPTNGRYRHILFRAVYMEGGREDLRRRNPLNFLLSLLAEILVSVVPKQRRFERELKMVGNKRQMQFGPFCSLC